MRLRVPILKTERLVLEPLTFVHSVGMYHLWSLPEVCEYAGDAADVDGYPIPLPAKSTADSDKIIEFFAHHQRAGTGFRWAVITVSNAAFVGALGFNSLGLRPELAFHLHPDYWGAGLMSEACRAAISWVSAELGAETVEAYVDPRNERSVRLLERLRFRPSTGTRDGALRYIHSGPAGHQRH
jgi:[ribosomal protein S5]-alanine N-acetyltransferase